LQFSRLQGGTLTDRKLPLAVFDETILDYPPPLAPCRVQASGELGGRNWSHLIGIRVNSVLWLTAKLIGSDRADQFGKRRSCP
jgi:hypothetical protein